MPEFNKPILGPKDTGIRVEILDKEIYGSAAVRKMLVQEIPKEGLKPGEEIRTKHFFIKQIPNAEDMLFFNRGIVFMDEEGNPLGPESLVRNFKKLYERHREWYDGEMPGFVINKYYVLMQDDKGEKHGYVIKKDVVGIEEPEGIGMDFGGFLHETKIANDKDVLLSLISQIKYHLPGSEQQAIFCNELKKFVSITRKIIEKEKVMPDLGGGRLRSNLRITPEGHLRMIDTDRVYQTENKKGEKDFVSNQYKQILNGLEYVADHLMN